MGARRARRRLGAKTTALVASAAIAGLLSACGSSGAPSASTSTVASPSVTVMTRNMYFGADLSPLFNATAAQLGPEAAVAYQQMQASDIPDRIQSDAREVAAAKPDLLALQEAVVWSKTASGEATPTVQYDFTSLLLADLSRVGITYRVASSTDGFSGALPVPDVGLVTLQDRDVILVRAGSAVTVSGPTSGDYQHALTINVAGIPITVKRGWAAVNASIGGRQFRMIATHLEAYSDPTRDAQAQELLSMVGASSGSTLVLGDINSAAQGAGSQTYDMVRAAGLGDAWASAEGGDAGYTCCRDADLRGGSLTQRIDMVFYRGQFKATKAEVVGAGGADRTPGGLWPSDHAGVVASLTVPT
ncbi:MAG TPA: endonuclease/exonuclease/phosphatase family protein [Acidimicrobiales bacterium]|nr:endonuclease/exonuclease/phosphatase family protein [Acidimicrobiales bacterium]